MTCFLNRHGCSAVHAYINDIKFHMSANAFCNLMLCIVCYFDEGMERAGKELSSPTLYPVSKLPFTELCLVSQDHSKVFLEQKKTP